MGGAVGLAVISAVAASYTASLTHDSGPQALTSGYNLAMAVAAGITLLASVIAATIIRASRPAPATTTALTAASAERQGAAGRLVIVGGESCVRVSRAVWMSGKVARRARLRW
jgi:ABC-type thiamin/hydroxymethylpyrimidine transport system permease subunit